MAQAALEIVPEETTALIVKEELDALKIYSCGGLDLTLDYIRAEVALLDADVSTGAGRDAIRTMAMAVRKAKVILEDLGKSLVDDQKKQLAVIDGERRRMKDALDELAVEVRRPLTEYEDEQKALKAAKELAAQIVKDEAEAHTMNVIEDERRAVAAEKAELCRLDSERVQKEREDRIAREAAEAAVKREREANEEKVRDGIRREEQLKLDKERLERERVEAADRVEREKAEAQERADRKTREAVELAERTAREEADRIKREAAAVEERARLEKEKREADTKHRGQINTAVMAALIDRANLTKEQAMEVVIAIVRGEVPNTTIAY